MNSFYIPALAGQIYAMPGMETKLHAVINHAGTYEGFSANYSGAGFSGMRFAFHGLDRRGLRRLDREGQGQPAARSAATTISSSKSRARTSRCAATAPSMPISTTPILNMCVEPGKMCMSEMMAIDAKGGLGQEGLNNTLPLAYDKYARRGAVFGPEPTFVAGICTPPMRREAPDHGRDHGAARHRAAHRRRPEAADLHAAASPRPCCRSDNVRKSDS